MSWFRRRAKDIATSYRIAFGPMSSDLIYMAVHGRLPEGDE